MIGQVGEVRGRSLYKAAIAPISPRFDLPIHIGRVVDRTARLSTLQ